MVIRRWLQKNNQSAKSPQGGWIPGLSARLFFMTIVFILIAEAMIFVPSAANFRAAYLNSRVEMAQTAVLAVEAAPQRRVSDTLSLQLLENERIIAVAASSDMGSEIILAPSMAIEGNIRLVDLRTENIFQRLLRGPATLFDNNTDFLRVLDTPRFEGEFIEVVLDIAPLRDSLRDYSLRLLWLSLFVSTFVGVLIYLVLLYLVVRPIRRITKSIEGFRDDPRGVETRILPSNRQDEIGRAENTLSDMETTVKAAFRERERMAQLGEAMAKINHDLRNSLSAAQIVTDGLAMSKDPRVRRAAPRLERALERAIKLAEDTLKFGRSEPVKPQIGAYRLKDIVDEAISEGQILNGTDTLCENHVEADIRVSCDPEHLHRILVNLIRNAVQAIDAETSRDEPGKISLVANTDAQSVTLLIRDNGPGIPEKVRETLFMPFSPSRSKGGSGLGLAIAKELADGMKARLTFISTGPEGTVFQLVLPCAAGS
ncbi:MAG: histidine kinase [Ponticaulis sp.]|nr:histidine kinase [Ponticaulis sp.]|tara:strand:- start:31641 stop:33095 length:1455 start_codon:yes stop_codon:yes gene_type:complete